MKFSGSGNIAFKLFGNHYKKTLKKELRKKRKDATTLAERLIQDYYSPTKPKTALKIQKRLEEVRLSKWEKQVFSVLEKNGIKFEKKFRKFPLKISDTITIPYVPDFLLNDYEIGRKEIIIEAHEKITQDEIAVNSTFMKDYHDAFYLIMVVRDVDIRAWNEANNENRLFHEICAINGLDWLVNFLKKQKKKKLMEAKCPTCHAVAIGYIQVQTKFGLRKKRNGDEFPQSLCMDCRKDERKLGTVGLKDKINNSQRDLGIGITRFCTCCNGKFITKKADVRFCEKCLEKWN